MKSVVKMTKALLLFSLAGSLLASCVITAQPARTKTVVIKDDHHHHHHHHHKPHPHGGPPGQQKKAPGHPGKHGKHHH